MTELTLFGEQPVPRATLHPRQQLVLDTLHAADHEGLRADEAGAAIHAGRGKHGVDVRCDWCAREGGEVLRRLHQLGHARRDRHHNWRAVSLPAAQDAQDGDPFPEGY